MIFLGLDVGTSSCKCSAFDANGELIAEASREYAKTPGQTGLDAENVFADVCAAVGGCAKQIKDKCGNHQISSVTVSSFGESFVAINKSGGIMSDIIIYSDSGGDKEVEILKQKVPDIAKIAGANPKAFYALPKMMHVLKTRPEIAKNLWKFLQVSDYIIHRLCGEAVIDYSVACRSLALDVLKQNWSPEILAAAGLDANKLSSPVPAGTVAGVIHKHLAGELNLPEDTKIVVGVHDQIASAAGAGALREGEAVVGTGSVECITPVFGSPRLDPGFLDCNFACIPHVAPGRYATYAFTMSGGSLLTWYRDRIVPHLKITAKEKNCSVYKLLDESCPKEPSDLIIVPHFGGTGTPELDPLASGTMAGFSMTMGLPEIYRAILEGLCFELRYNRDRLALFDVTFSTLRATGGGTRSDIWLQLKADILGIPVSPLRNADAGTAGGAMLAAVATGEFSSFEEAAKVFVKVREPFLPDGRKKEYYDEKYGKYKRLRQAMTGGF